MKNCKIEIKERDYMYEDQVEYAEPRFYSCISYIINMIKKFNE